MLSKCLSRSRRWNCKIFKSLMIIIRIFCSLRSKSSSPIITAKPAIVVEMPYTPTPPTTKCTSSVKSIKKPDITEKTSKVPAKVKTPLRTAQRRFGRCQNVTMREEKIERNTANVQISKVVSMLNELDSDDEFLLLL